MDFGYEGKVDSNWAFRGTFTCMSNINAKLVTYEVYIHKTKPIWCHRVKGLDYSRGGGEMINGLAVSQNCWTSEWLAQINECIKFVDPSVSPNA